MKSSQNIAKIISLDIQEYSNKNGRVATCLCKHL